MQSAAPPLAAVDLANEPAGSRTPRNEALLPVLAGQDPKAVSAPARAAVNPSSTAKSAPTALESVDDFGENPMTGMFGWLDDDLFHVREDPSTVAPLETVAPQSPHPPALVPGPETPPAPTLQEAVRELAAFEYIHPGWAAVALSTRATTLEDLYLAQNDLSVRFIGAVASSHAGKARALIPAGQEPAWVGRALQALRAGRDLEFTDQIVLGNGELQWARFKMRHAGLLLLVGAQAA